MIKPSTVLLFLLLLTACKSQNSKQKFQELKGKVIAVKDGDTIEILCDEKLLTIRFAHVDCPEIRKKQPFGTTAKQFTSALCFGRLITVQHENKFDRYKRLIGVVINDEGKNVNKELVKAGYAWHFMQYSNDMEYNRLEKTAREKRVGLWVDSNPAPPWQWRAPKSKKPLKAVYW
jgi:micrococcal nuclease